MHTPAKLLITLVLFLASAMPLAAQSPNDPVSLTHPNIPFLEHVLKEMIDSVRISHGLTPLVNDSLLYRAAGRHGEYLMQRRLFSHFEDDVPECKTPSDRVYYAGGRDYSMVGENLVKAVLNKPTLIREKKKKPYTHTARTYEELARHMTIAWVNSPGHFANIITEGYNVTGMSIQYDTARQEFQAVQKFGRREWQYPLLESRETFPYSDYKPIVEPIDSSDWHHLHSRKHSWKLKAPKDTSRNHFELLLDTNQTIVLQRVKNTIYLTSRDINLIRNLFIHRGDKIAAEIVTYTPYHCGHPRYYQMHTRRNGKCLFNGKIMKPVKQKVILSGIRKDIWKLRLAKLPRDIPGYFEVNALLIHKKAVSRVIHFSGKCGHLYMPEFSFQPLGLAEKKPLQLQPKQESYHFRIPFEKGQYEFKPQDIQPLLDSLTDARFRIHRLSISAYASVEGSAEVNLVLQRKRAESITNALREYTDQGLHPDIQSAINIPLFRQQMKKPGNREVPKDTTEEAIFSFFADTLQARVWEPLLKQERYADVTMEVVVDTGCTNYPMLLRSLHKRWAAWFKKGKSFTEPMIDSLETAGILANEICKRCGIPDTQKQFNPPVKTPFLLYHYYRLTRGWDNGCGEVNDSISFIRNLNIYKELFRNSGEAPQIRYDILTRVFRYYRHPGVQQKFPARYLATAMDSLKERVSSWETQGLLPQGTAHRFTLTIALCQLNGFVLTPDSLEENPPAGYHSGPNAETNKLADYITAYYFTYPAPAEEISGIASLLLYYGYSSYALSLLHERFEDIRHLPDAYALYLKLMYQHPQEFPQSQYVQMLLDAFPVMGKENWCPMFIGECNISFQIMDDEHFRNFYCSQCSDYRNPAMELKPEN